MKVSSRSIALVAAFALLLVGVSGCNKGADTTTGATAPPPTVTPQVQAQIDASQKADAARHAAMSAGKAK